jgi:hypothetical protein
MDPSDRVHEAILRIAAANSSVRFNRKTHFVALANLVSDAAHTA